MNSPFVWLVFDVAHLKVRAKCTKPLPTVAELVRSDGSIHPSLCYLPPALPPPLTFPCCNRLSHIEQRCPNAKWPPSAKESNAPDTANIQTIERQLLILTQNPHLLRRKRGEATYNPPLDILRMLLLLHQSIYLIVSFILLIVILLLLVLLKR